MFKILNAYMNPSGKYILTEGTKNLYRVYKNPNAKDLFIKAQMAKTIEERQRLFDMMGEYKMVNKNHEKSHKNRLMQFLKGLFNAG